MSATSVYNYRVYCVTEGSYKTVWDTVEPTCCPTNTAHTINSTLTTIVDQIDQNVVVVKESSILTGGNFMSQTVIIPTAPGETGIVNCIWPFPMVAMAVKTATEEVHRGDIFSIAVAPNTTIGVITADIAPVAAWSATSYPVNTSVSYNGAIYTSTTTTNTTPPLVNGTLNAAYWQQGYRITCSPTVVQNINAGYYVRITDGVHVDDLQRCISYNVDTNCIYTELAPANSYAAATPTYVQMTVYTIKDFVFGAPAFRNIGESKIGGSGIPANTLVQGVYTNTSTNTSKTFIGEIEYLY